METEVQAYLKVFWRYISIFIIYTHKYNFEAYVCLEIML